MLSTPEHLIETFDLLDDWEQRYAYLIELGRALPPFPDALRQDDVLVPGCTSRVWLVAERHGDTWHFYADSDAAIVKGLVAVLMIHVQDKSAPEIIACDLKATFERLGLGAHLSPSRRNGFFAMVERVKKLAA